MKNKAFTLIELLAVIVILSIIALIATPLILNIIEKVRKNAFLDSAYGIVDSAKLYYAESLLDGKSGSAKVFSFDEGNNELTFGGSKPKGGIVAIDKDGKVSIAIYNDTWCAQKNEEGSTVVISKYESDKCTLNSIPEVPDNPVEGQNVELFMTNEKAGANGSIRTDNSGNKRYAGSDPNNYMCFGIEGDTCDEEHLYRIIGVFEQGTKIIKNSFYSTSIPWDTSNSNNWDRPATLKTELNGSSFYDNTNYIDEMSRGYIVNAFWYIGSFNDRVSDMYLKTFEDTEQNEASKGYIGLMSVTDFGYSSNSGCDRNTYINNKNCFDGNWLYNDSYYQWTITNNNYRDDYVWYILTTKRIGNSSNGTTSKLSVRPSMYLKPEVKIISGEGTIDKPYLLSI